VKNLYLFTKYSLITFFALDRHSGNSKLIETYFKNIPNFLFCVASQQAESKGPLLWKPTMQEEQPGTPSVLVKEAFGGRGGGEV